MSLVNQKLKKELHRVVVTVFDQCLAAMKKPVAGEKAGIGKGTQRASQLSEVANETMLAFLLQHQEEFGCDDKKGVLVSTALDLFCDLA